MHPMMQRNIDTGYCTEMQAEYIQKALDNKESLIVSGHKSAGIRVFMALIMALAKGQYTTVQVNGEDSFDEDAEYYLIPEQPGDFEALVTKGYEKASIVTVKENDLPYSIRKIMNQYYRATEDGSKVVTMLECTKTEDSPDGIPFLDSMMRHVYNDKGRVQVEEIKRDIPVEG